MLLNTFADRIIDAGGTNANALDDFSSARERKINGIDAVMGPVSDGNRFYAVIGYMYNLQDGKLQTAHVAAPGYGQGVVDFKFSLDPLTGHAEIMHRELVGNEHGEVSTPLARQNLSSTVGLFNAYQGLPSMSCPLKQAPG